MLLLGILALAFGVGLAMAALLASLRFGFRLVVPLSFLPLVITLTGILGVHKAPNLVLAPLVGLAAAYQLVRGKSYGHIIAGAALPGLAQGVFLMVAASQEPQLREELADQVLGQFESLELPAGVDADAMRLLLISLLRLEPAMEYMAGLLTAVLAYGMAVFAARRLGWTLPPAAPMREWRLWDRLIWVLIGGMGLKLIVGDGLVDDLAVNALVVMVVLYAVQGFSLTRFYIWRMRIPRSLEFLFYAVLLFASGISSWVLAGVGLLDTRFDWRRLATKENEHEEVEEQ